MKPREIQFCWKRAIQSLKSAQVLHKMECYEDSISRSYYATLYAAKAALLVFDRSASSHTAVRRLFGLHLIKTGEIEREWSDILFHEYDTRGMADYDIAYIADEEDAQDMLQAAARFVRRIGRYLEMQGIDLPIPFPHNRYFSDGP